VWGSEVWDEGLGLRDSGLWFGVEGFWFGVYGLLDAVMQAFMDWG